MFGSGILDVAVGLIFVYFFLSLICSVITEWISRIRSLRAITLEQGIRKLLRDSHGNGLAKKFYEHPLIEGITRDGHKPSYIPSHLFTLCLIDIIAPADSTKGVATFTEIRRSLPKELYGVILPLLDSAEGDLSKARQNIEQWFDHSMDRISGWYKKKIQVFAIGLAFGITFITNADTLYLVKAFYNDSTLRNSFVTAAQKTVKERDSNTTAISIKMNDDVSFLRMPMGWPDPFLCRQKGTELSWRDVFFWGEKVLGWILTAVAVSLGAPFWFDTLNRIANLRSTGQKPERE